MSPPGHSVRFLMDFTIKIEKHIQIH